MIGFGKMTNEKRTLAPKRAVSENKNLQQVQ